MSRIGLIGGTTWQSTIEYYRCLNEMVNERLGGSHSADLVLVSLDFDEIVQNNANNDLAANGALIVRAAKTLSTTGVAAIVPCANTMHMFAKEIEEAAGVPVISIITATANAIKKQGMSKVALLGTRYTMEMDFYKTPLREQGIETLIPDEADRKYIHDSIFNELGKGIFLPEMRERYVAIIESLVAQGAQGIILGCTEIPLLISDDDVSVPTFDTIRLHAEAAVEFMVG